MFLIIFGIILFGLICYCVGYNDAPKVPDNKPKLKYVAEKMYDVKKNNNAVLFLIDKDILDNIIKKMFPNMEQPILLKQ